MEQPSHESVKPGAGGSVNLMLTSLELIEHLATLTSPACQQAAEAQKAAIRCLKHELLLWVDSSHSTNGVDRLLTV